MQRVTAEHRDSLIETFAREALHLEMRDVYAAADHSRFRRWLAGETFDPAEEAEWWRSWREMMRRHQDAGRTLRRLRVVSEPVTRVHQSSSGWTRTSWSGQARTSVGSPGSGRPSSCLPGNDFWCFDCRTVVFTHFSGDGEVQGYELTSDPALVARCAAAFEEAWSVAVPNGEYDPPS